MAIIETKFSVGDKVYHPFTQHDHEEFTCPDCDGTKVIHVEFAGGRREEIDCVTCRDLWGHSSGKLKKPSLSVVVVCYTIGSVGIDERGPRYMCNETGVGSGSVYYEDTIFLTEKEAVEASEKTRTNSHAHIAENNFDKNKFSEKLQSHLGCTRAESYKMQEELKDWIKTIRGERKERVIKRG